MVQVKEVVSKQANVGNSTAISKVSPLGRFIADPAREFNGKSAFEAQFRELYGFENEGEISKQRKVYLTDFPGDKALKIFLEESNEGDALFIEKLPVKNGGVTWANTPEPIPDMNAYVEKIKEKKLSVYSCHIPFLTLNPLSVSLAVAERINGKVTGGCVFNDKKDNISLIICELDNIAADSVGFGTETLEEVFEPAASCVKKAAIAAGPSCIKVKWKEEAEKRGADIYLAVDLQPREAVGTEIRSDSTSNKSDTHISLPCLNLSINEADYILKKQLMKKWVEDNLGIPAVLIS